MGCYLLEAGKEGGTRFLSGFEKLSKLSVLNWKYWSKKLQNKITRAVYKKKNHYAAQGVSKYFRCCSSSAHTPVACSRIKQPVRNPAMALCPLAAASPRTASLFPMNSGSALSCLNHLEEEKKKKSRSVDPNEILRLKCLWSQGKLEPKALLGSSGLCQWTKAISPHQAGMEDTQPNFPPADVAHLQAQQSLIGTLRSSIEGNETEGCFSKLAQVSQRELQRGKPALKEIHSPSTAESFPEHFAFLSDLGIYTVNKKWEIVTQLHKKIGFFKLQV